MLQACGLLREVQQAALQTGGKLEETSFMTPLLQGGFPRPQLARVHARITAARLFSASFLRRHLCVLHVN